MDSILLPSNFDVNGVQYGTPKTNDNGGKSIYLSLKRSPIVLQTPEMYAPFGLTKWENDSGTTKYTLDLSFKDMDKRDTLKTFFEKMMELDDKLIDDGTTNAFEWLKKKGASREVVKHLYTKLVKFPVDKTTGEVSTKYPPTFKLSLPFKEGAFQCEVYDAERKRVDLNTIETKGSRVTAIIQCLGVWVAAGKFGCTWKVLQMKVVPPQNIRGYAFKEMVNDHVEEEISDDEDDKSVDVDEVLNHAPVITSSKNDDDIVESSEDGEEDDLDVKPPPPPAVVSKSKSVVSKKK
jgi:hypothetical protein